MLVVHLGTPAAKSGSRRQHARRRHCEAPKRFAGWRSRSACGSRFEVIPNEHLDAGRCSSTCSNGISTRRDAGICLDFGHAHLMGDVADAVEIAAEHVIATHVHDNRGREDDHLVPYLGTINWDVALMTMQKIGYEGDLPDGAGQHRLAGGGPRGRAARASAL